MVTKGNIVVKSQEKWRAAQRIGQVGSREVELVEELLFMDCFLSVSLCDTTRAFSSGGELCCCGGPPSWGQGHRYTLHGAPPPTPGAQRQCCQQNKTAIT